MYSSTSSPNCRRAVEDSVLSRIRTGRSSAASAKCTSESGRNQFALFSNLKRGVFLSGSKLGSVARFKALHEALKSPAVVASEDNAVAQKLFPSGSSQSKGSPKAIDLSKVTLRSWSCTH